MRGLRPQAPGSSTDRPIGRAVTGGAPQPRPVRPEIDAVLRRYGGVAGRRRLLTCVSAAALDDEIRRGRLTRVFRRAYCRPWDADLPAIRERAALVSVGRGAVLSHTTAVRRWGVEVPPCDLVEVTLLDRRLSRPQPGLVVHRTARLPPSATLSGLPTARLEDALVMVFARPDLDGRALVIDAVRRRRTSVDVLDTAIAGHPRARGRRELAGLVSLLRDGCESELEIWGHAEVFSGAAFARGRRQVVVPTAAGTFRLDLAFEAERVAVELDGWAFHSSREQRERDMRRDAALAAAGWLVIRLSHRRLHDDPDGCRRDVLAALGARRPRITAR